MAVISFEQAKQVLKEAHLREGNQNLVLGLDFLPEFSQTLCPLETAGVFAA